MKHYPIFFTVFSIKNISFIWF